jgi:hypothetical protein
MKLAVIPHHNARLFGQIFKALHLNFGVNNSHRFANRPKQARFSFLSAQTIASLLFSSPPNSNTILQKFQGFQQKQKNILSNVFQLHNPLQENSCNLQFLFALEKFREPNEHSFLSLCIQISTHHLSALLTNSPHLLHEYFLLAASKNQPFQQRKKEQETKNDKAR